VPTALTKKPNSRADGCQPPRKFPLVPRGTPPPVAHSGAGPVSVKSIPTWYVAPARTIASYGAQAEAA
jgi:hypothetical protein